MSRVFWLHTVVVLAGFVFSVLNLAEAWRDFEVVRSRRVHGAVEVIAYSWVVREVIHLLIQGTFLSFIVLLLLAGPSAGVEPQWWVALVEMRSLWVSGFVLILSCWDWGVRRRLQGDPTP